MELVGVIRVGRLESVGVGGMVMVGGNVVRIDVEISKTSQIAAGPPSGHLLA